MSRSFQLELPDVTGEEIPGMNDDDLRQFVYDLMVGRIFTHRQIREESMIGVVFMPLMFGALSGWSDTGLSNIGAIWEYVEKAGPRSINGYPIFHSLRLINVHDWEIALQAMRKESERQKDIEL